MSCKYFRAQRWNRFKESMKRPAIVVVDMQMWFTHVGSPLYFSEADRVADKIASFLEDISGCDEVPVIFTKHVDMENGPMHRWWGNVLDEYSPYADIDRRFQGFAKYVVKKSTYDAFYNTLLDDILVKESIDTLIILGVRTHLCVDTTARSAFVRGYHVVVPCDGVADKPNDVHECALKNLAYGIAHIPPLDEVRRWLGIVL